MASAAPRSTGATLKRTLEMLVETVVSVAQTAGSFAAGAFVVTAD
jgi:hypothetical protein